MQTITDDDKRLELYISYETVVAYRLNIPGKYEYIISENCWGPTTGKHLNWLDDDKKRRVSRDDFEAKLEQAQKDFYNEHDELLVGFKQSEEYQNAVYLYLKKNNLVAH